MARCTGSACGLCWLDPMPMAEDLALAYRSYYTHAGSPRGGPLRLVYLRAVDGYFARTLGYPSGDGLGRVLSRVFALSPGRRETLDLMTFGLAPIPGGRCVDVGCGDGARVGILRRLGWDAEGVDPDPVAIERGRGRGLPIHLGALEDRAYPAASLDAVTLAHVIEHLPDPVGTLRECRRVLKPGGRVVIVTPNTASLGHRVFGARWRGLEPPRHLWLFDRRSLARTVEASGLRVAAWTTLARIAGTVFEESVDPHLPATPPQARRRTASRRLAAWRFERRERALLARDPESGEELRLVAER